MLEDNKLAACKNPQPRPLSPGIVESFPSAFQSWTLDLA